MLRGKPCIFHYYFLLIWSRCDTPDIPPSRFLIIPRVDPGGLVRCIFGSQNLPQPPRLQPPFSNYKRPSQNLPHDCNLPEYTPLKSFQQIYATLPESTPTPQPPPLSTTICDSPRIYPYLPEYTPLSNNYMRPSQTLPLPPRIHPPPFQQLYATFQNLPLPTRIYPLFNNYMLYSQKRPVPPRIYPPFQQLMRPSQNLPLPPRIHLPFQKLYATLPFNNYMRHSRIYPYLPEYTPFSTTICDPPRIYPYFPEYTSLFNK